MSAIGSFLNDVEKSTNTSSVSAFTIMMSAQRETRCARLPDVMENQKR